VFNDNASIAGNFILANTPGGTMRFNTSLVVPGCVDIGGVMTVGSASQTVTINCKLALEPGATLNNPGTVRVGRFDNNGGAVNGNAPVLLGTPLSISPAIAAAGPGQNISFSGSGGNAPYTFNLAQNNSGASFVPATHIYTAGPTVGVTDTILITDSFGCTASATVRVGVPTNHTIHLSPGDNLIANQLDRGGNTLDEVLPNVPNGSQLIKWNGAFAVYTYNSLLPGWSPNGTATLAPGEGAIFRFPPGDPSTTLTFACIPHLPALPLSLSCGHYYLVSRQTNGIGTFENITGSSPQDGTKVLRHIPGTPVTPLQAGNYNIYTFSGGIWSPAVPQLDVGESAWIRVPCFGSGCVTVQAPDIVVLSNVVTQVGFAPTVTDTCGNTIESVACSPPSGSLFAPGTTPPALVARINALLHQAVDASDTRERLRMQGVEPQLLRPDQFCDKVKSEIEQWAPVIIKSGMKGSL
jgi:hypothetical protein